LQHRSDAEGDSRSRLYVSVAALCVVAQKEIASSGVREEP